MRVRGPDSWTSWKSAVLAGFIQIPVLICLRTMGVVFVSFLDDWHLPRRQASWPLTLFIVSSQICAPVFPLVQKSFSPSSLLTSCCALLCCAQLFVYFAKNIWHFAVLFFVQGIAVGGIYMFSTLIFMQHFKSKRSAGTGLASTISSGLTTLVPIMLQSLIDKQGIRIAVPVLGGLSFISVVLSFFLKTPSWFSVEHRTRLEHKSIEQSSRAKNKELIPLDEATPDTLSVLPNQGLRYICTGRFLMDVFCIVVIYNANNTFLLIAYDYARDQAISESSALYVLPLCSVGDLTMRLLSGFLIDSKIIRWTAFFAGVFLLEAICVSIWLTSSSLFALLVLSLLFGGCTGSLVSLIPILLVNDFGLERFTSSLGASLLVCGLVSAFRPLLDGYFRDVRGSYDGLFIIIVVLCVPSAIYWLYRTVEENRSDNRKLTKDASISKNVPAHTVILESLSNS